MNDMTIEIQANKNDVTMKIHASDEAKEQLIQLYGSLMSETDVQMQYVISALVLSGSDEDKIDMDFLRETVFSKLYSVAIDGGEIPEAHDWADHLVSMYKPHLLGL